MPLISSELLAENAGGAASSSRRKRLKPIPHPSQSTSRLGRGGEIPQPPEPICVTPSGEAESLQPSEPVYAAPSGEAENPSSICPSPRHAHGQSREAISRPCPCHALGRCGEYVNRLSLCPRHVCPQRAVSSLGTLCLPSTCSV
jgi:hypothetical protein